MITEGKILALLLKLRDAGHNKAGRLRDTLLISSNAVQSATEAHKRTVHQAMNYLTAMRLSRYGLKREEEKERKKGVEEKEQVKARNWRRSTSVLGLVSHWTHTSMTRLPRAARTQTARTHGNSLLLLPPMPPSHRGISLLPSLR